MPETEVAAVQGDLITGAETGLPGNAEMGEGKPSTSREENWSSRIEKQERLSERHRHCDRDTSTERRIGRLEELPRELVCRFKRSNLETDFWLGERVL